MILRYLKYVYNFFDQIPLEQIKTGKRGSSSEFNPTGFTIGLRAFDLIILYSIYYAFYKGVQFVVSLLLRTGTDQITMAYYAIPILLFTEVGLSKLNSADPRNFSIYFFRAFLKFEIVNYLDKLLTAILF